MSIFKPIIVANWKANKTEEEALLWIEKVGSFLKDKKFEIILCPSFVFISPLKSRLEALGFSNFIHLGAQNISHYDNGPYTGEVTARQLNGLVEYSLVGHSERRRFFNESKDDIFKKINLARKWRVKPILLIDLPQIDEVSLYSNQEMLICYEPVSAISTPGEYHPDNPESAFLVAKKIMAYNRRAIILYGGSVNRENAQSFLKVGFCGFVVGQASLDEDDFIGLVTASLN